MRGCDLRHRFLSRLTFDLAECRKSQPRMQASPYSVGRHCCPPSFMIDAGQQQDFHLGTATANWAAISEAWRCRLPGWALGGGAELPGAQVLPGRGGVV